jgi:putative GTP pyrophosphokinase
MEIKLWREILNPYELAVEELKVKLEHLVKEHKEQGEYSPIESVNGRVKTISSILDKAQKKKIAMEDIEEQIEDIAGLRIICQFVEDIEKVVALIKSRTDMEVKSEKDYITKMKMSGYRSYHLIVYYTVETMRGSKKLQVEIQIRTLAMNFWATIEHSLQYKYKKNIPDHIRKRLSKAADAIIVLDNEMSSIRNEIMDAQNSFQIQANLVADILNNIQNLYKAANKREVLKIQDEFYRIYELNDLEQLERFHKQLDIIAEGYNAQDLENKK